MLGSVTVAGAQVRRHARWRRTVAENCRSSKAKARRLGSVVRLGLGYRLGARRRSAQAVALPLARVPASGSATIGSRLAATIGSGMARARARARARPRSALPVALARVPARARRRSARARGDGSGSGSGSVPPARRARARARRRSALAVARARGSGSVDDRLVAAGSGSGSGSGSRDDRLWQWLGLGLWLRYRLRLGDDRLWQWLGLGLVARLVGSLGLRLGDDRLWQWLWLWLGLGLGYRARGSAYRARALRQLALARVPAQARPRSALARARRLPAPVLAPAGLSACGQTASMSDARSAGSGGRSDSGQASAGASIPRSARKSMVGAGGWCAVAAGREAAAGGLFGAVSSAARSLSEKTTPRHGSTCGSNAGLVGSSGALAGSALRGRPHSSNSTPPLDRLELSAAEASPAVQVVDPVLAAKTPRLAVPPPTASPSPCGGRSVRHPPASTFQHLVQTYWRQSMQKWKVPANASLEGDAVETEGRSSAAGFSAARRPKRPSRLLLPSLAGGGSGALDV